MFFTKTKKTEKLEKDLADLKARVELNHNNTLKRLHELEQANCKHNFSFVKTLKYYLTSQKEYAYYKECNKCYLKIKLSANDFYEQSYKDAKTKFKIHFEEKEK